MESGEIPDEAITASSSYVPNVGPKSGRWVTRQPFLLVICNSHFGKHYSLLPQHLPVRDIMEALFLRSCSFKV